MSRSFNKAEKGGSEAWLPRERGCATGSGGGGAVTLFCSGLWSIDSLQTLHSLLPVSRRPGHTAWCPWYPKACPTDPFSSTCPSWTYSLTDPLNTHEAHSLTTPISGRGGGPLSRVPIQPVPAISSRWRQHWIVRMGTGSGASLPGSWVQIPLRPLAI